MGPITWKRGSTTGSPGWPRRWFASNRRGRRHWWAGSPEIRSHAYTLLRVAAGQADGSARCTVFTNLQSPFAVGASVAGYRCLKLGTVRGPIAVRLIGDDGVAATTSLASVRATETGFA